MNIKEMDDQTLNLCIFSAVIAGDWKAYRKFIAERERREKGAV